MWCVSWIKKNQFVLEDTRDIVCINFKSNFYHSLLLFSEEAVEAAAAARHLVSYVFHNLLEAVASSKSLFYQFVTLNDGY